MFPLTDFFDMTKYELLNTGDITDEEIFEKDKWHYRSLLRSCSVAFLSAPVDSHLLSYSQKRRFREIGEKLSQFASEVGLMEFQGIKNQLNFDFGLDK